MHGAGERQIELGRRRARPGLPRKPSILHVLRASRRSVAPRARTGPYAHRVAPAASARRMRDRRRAPVRIPAPCGLRTPSAVALVPRRAVSGGSRPRLAVPRQEPSATDGASMATAPYEPGTILAGRYQVRRELGRGGMGVVYLCRDLVVDERVALKLLIRPGAKMRPEDAWWFHEEARALAGLAHPAIVRARDFGTLDDGTPYLAMDAVPGPLAPRVDLPRAHRRPAPLADRLDAPSIRSSARSRTRTRAASSTATSSRRTSCSTSRPTATTSPTVHVLDLGLAWLMQDRVDHRLDGSAARPSPRCAGARARRAGWRRSRSASRRRTSARPPISTRSAASSSRCSRDREPYAGTNDELLAAAPNGAGPRAADPARRAARGRRRS